MRLLVSLLIAVLAAESLARLSTTLEPMNWSTVPCTNVHSFTGGTKKDLLGYADCSDTVSSISTLHPAMVVRRRNSEGIYVNVGNFTETIAPFVVTNGKWVAIWSSGSLMSLFSVDSNNVISPVSYIETYGGYLLSDDTFVDYDGNRTITTFQYEASNNTWNNIPAADLIINTPAYFYMGEVATYRATDTHLVFADYTNSSDLHIQIYRQADKSWKFVESVPINSTFSELGETVNYNDIDTLTFSAPANYAGIVFTYTKINGGWTEQTFTTESVGYRPQGGLGTWIAFLDTNTLLLSAAYEGYEPNGALDNIGKVLLMTRKDGGLWEPTIDLVNPTGTKTGNSGYWGLLIGVNDYDIIIPHVTVDEKMTYYTAPRCFTQPINVTCVIQQVSDCSQLDILSLYTINNAQCGDVTSSFNGLSLVNCVVQAQLSFTRKVAPVVSTAYCNATVTCSAPPVAVVQQPSPSKVSSAVVLIQSGLASLFLAFALLFS